MDHYLRYSLIALAGFAVIAGLCLLIADSGEMEAFLLSKIYGGLLCLVGLAAIAHLDKKGGNDA